MTSSSSGEKLAAANYGLPLSQKHVYHLLRESSRLAELLHLQHSHVLVQHTDLIVTFVYLTL